MKQLTLLILSLALMLSCSEDEKEEATLPVANFEITVTGESPNAELTINNLSSDATSYEWTFGEGAGTAASTEANPVNVTVDKAGMLEITLTAENSDGSDTKTDSVEIPGNSAIITYSDLYFGRDTASDYGRFFSFDTEEMHFDEDINSENGNTIHIGFDGYHSSVLQFFSPDNDGDAGFVIPNAQHTVVENYQSSPVITVQEFENMEDDRLLAPMTVVYDQDVFGSSTIPNMVFFELADGRKGAIKVKELNNDNALTDIKIQKY